jgi:hypothetical protein
MNQAGVIRPNFWFKESVMEKRKILAGYYRDWSIKSPSRKTKSYREEAGDECLEVKTELEAPAGKCSDCDGTTRIPCGTSQSEGYRYRGRILKRCLMFCKNSYIRGTGVEVLCRTTSVEQYFEIILTNNLFYHKIVIKNF